MRLKSIKLAGFKSFVDSTEIKFPTNLTSIVGPNGCGKSNTIDAVRWVMGESSAKHLRGESMADVIFNGSNARKPTAQAFVELVFDNSDGSLKGEYITYNEIALKRLVTRDGQSTYFLNNTRCRRRDITDIFLGTGLGPRSYAIIEQGMISRLIEAKPEELRVYIEEAAGISKYKERRKETESRMRRTRANLEQLDYLREELGRQLENLERQAAAAKKYKALREQERQYRAELQALKWKSMDSQVTGKEVAIRDLEVKLEAGIAEQRALDTAIERLRLQRTETNDSLNEIQGKYYGLGADIARIEQAIEHQKNRGSELRQSLEETIETCRETEQQLKQDNAEIEELAARQLELEPELELIQAREEESSEALVQAEETMHSWQNEWDDFNRGAQEPARRAEVQQSRIKHLDQSIERLGQRIERLQAEGETLNAGPLEQEVAELDERLEAARMSLERAEGSVTTLGSEINRQRESNNRINSELDGSRSEIQVQKGRHASLEALQQAALGEGELVAWLEQNSFGDKPRLMQSIKAHDGWEKAVETVLGDHLQAVCVDGLNAVTRVIESLKFGDLSFFERGNAAPVAVGKSDPDLQPLAGLIETDYGLSSLLDGVYACESLPLALGKRASLSDGESLVTRDGIWLGASWIRVSRDSDPQDGILKRQQELEELTSALELESDRAEELETQLEEGREALKELEYQRDEVQREVSELNSCAGDQKARLSARQVRLEQLAMRKERIGDDMSECVEQQAQEREEISDARMVLEEALVIMEADTLKREALQEHKEELRKRLADARQTAGDDRDESHRLQLQTESERTRLESVREGVERLLGQLQSSRKRRAEIEDSLQQSGDPVGEWQVELEEKLESQLQIEGDMTQTRASLGNCDHELRESNQQRLELEQATQGVRSSLEQTRMDWQGLQVERKTLGERLQESGFELDKVLQELPEDADGEQRERELERIGNRITRLGAINLAAIDEFTAQSERKGYLDAQNDDLNEALGILESAIRKIDKETRTRFRKTYDDVNEGLKTLFPKMFGGGEAYLELTGEDLLDTGIAIMARPPGKRNSTIHLLSGGEKALTAIALVFSIFKLNPAPFCMLDEVDAPLDDANVARYCRLVKEMSESVQFIYISHNKVAIEMASQLMGVTMHEPGVSRLVSVDVAEAAAMAAS